MSVREEGGGGLVAVEFAMGDYRVATDGRQSVLVAKGMTNKASREGLPSLPTMSRLLVLPRGTEPVIEDASQGAIVRLPLPLGTEPEPYAGANIKRSGPAAVPLDKENAMQPAPPIAVESIGAAGRWQVYRIEAHPVCYDPVDDSYTVVPTARLVLSAGGAKTAAETPHLPERYIIVSRPEFREGLRPFVEWKRQLGFDVDEVYSPSAGCDSVKALIDNLWTDPAGREPAYILLVGDAEQLAPYLGTTRPAGLGTHATDLYYAEHTGDYLPDALLGRWPVNDSAQLRAVVEKTIAYEQGQYIDSAQSRKMLLVAGSESRSVAPTTTNGQVSYVARETKAAHPEVDTLCYHNPASASRQAEIAADLGRGAAAVNYTAHCSTGGWTSPALTFDMVDTMTSSKPMLFVNNCCESNAFGGTCFGEQLLRKAGGGAIGVIGATNETLWDEDYYWAVGPKTPPVLVPAYDSLRPGAFDRWIGRRADAHTQGAMLMAGNMAVTASGSNYDRFYWETYCLLGDPSLMPIAGATARAQISAAALTAGSDSIRATATPGAQVAAVQEGMLLGAATADNSGNTIIITRQSVDTGRVVLTASGRNLVPQTATPATQRPASGVGFYNLAVGDSLVVFDIANLGHDTLRNLTITLEQNAADSATGALIAPVPEIMDSLAPLQRSRVEIGYTVAVLGQQRLWRASIVASASGASGSLPVRHTLANAYPALRLSIAGDGETDRLQAGGAYRLQADVEGSYDSVRLEIRLLPEDMVFGRADTMLAFTTGDSTRWVYADGEVHYKGWSTAKRGYLAVGTPVVGFEEEIGCLPWRQDGQSGWERDSAVHRNGRYSLRSGAIGDGQSSAIELEVEVMQRGEVCFYMRSSSEEMNDRMDFTVDGQVRGQAWGELDWTRCRATVEAGRHTLRWNYKKNERLSEGSDCVWIDDLQLPLILWDSTYGCAGAVVAGLTEIVPCPLAVHPNPAADHIIVETGSNLPTDVELHDMYGRLVATKHVADITQCRMDVRRLPEGLYVVVTRRGEETARSKIVIAR